MVRCADCGFCEPSPFMGHSDGYCTENIKNPKKIQDITADIECRKFVAKRPRWSTKDFHEWKDKHITMRRTFWIAISSLVISILVGIFATIYPIYSSQHLYEASRRADLSILDNVNYSITNHTFTLNISGQIRNEGVRATIFKSIEIRVSYTLKDGDLMYFSVLTTNSSELGWQNSTFLEKQSKPFFLRIIVPYVAYDQIEPNQRPETGSIRIKHDDGISIQEDIKTFPIED